MRGRGPDVEEAVQPLVLKVELHLGHPGCVALDVPVKDGRLDIVLVNDGCHLEAVSIRRSAVVARSVAR